MNYKQSKEILREIKKAKTVLVNCHVNPDVDSVASCLSIFELLSNLGKKITMISTEEIPSDIKFLVNVDKIQVIDSAKFDFGKYDLFIVLDSSGWDRILPDIDKDSLKMSIIVIDHHDSNKIEGKITLVDETASSTSEIIYLLMKDVGVEINTNLARNILAGIISDSGGFQYDKTSSRTLKIASEILDLGVNLNDLILKLFRSYSVDVLNFWGEILKKIKVDKDNRFAWVTIDLGMNREYKNIGDAKSLAANMFLRSIKDTDFGILMTQVEKRKMKASFRERNGFNVLKIASSLGGGGHKSAAGVLIENLSFSDAVEKVLAAARKVARNVKK